MKYLFHGTQVGGLNILKPSISLEYVSRVYATDDIAYAYVRAGKQLDEIREEYYRFDKPFEIAECYPNAFEHQFKCRGYIYLLDPKDFVQNPDTLEYISEAPVRPAACIRINNIWWQMNQIAERYSFVYDGNEEYWSNVRGGRIGYLERKLKNKRKMLEMRKGLC